MNREYILWIEYDFYSVMHACNPRIKEVEAGASRVQDHPWLYIQFEARLDT